MQGNQKNPLDELRLVNARRNTVRQERRVKNAKGRLSVFMRKRLQTAFIGALDRFEQEFGGELWQHGEHPSQLDEDGKYYREKWARCRDSVLENGNDQIDLAQEEIAKFSILEYQSQQTFLKGKSE